VTGKQISELPLTEGTAYQLATLAPGIAYTGNPLFTGPTSNGNLAAFRSNGATGANQITLDGSPNYAFDGGVGFSPPSDAVQEFKVQTNTFDAQQGYSAGATVNVAVKSGSISIAIEVAPRITSSATPAINRDRLGRITASVVCLAGRWLCQRSITARIALSSLCRMSV
jgi:hypothetical protein